MGTADGRPITPLSSNDSMCLEPQDTLGFSPPCTPDAGTRPSGPRKDHQGKYVEHTVLGDPEEFAKMLAEYEAEERANRPPEPERAPEPEDVSYLPQEIFQAMSALPPQGAKAMLEAYKARAGQRYVAYTRG